MSFGNIFLELNPGFWIFILCVLVAIGFSIFAYQTTIPPVSNVKRIILSTLRALALIVILFLAFEPVLNYKFEEVEKPLTVVLWDNSESMKIKDSKFERETLVKELYTKNLPEALDGLEVLSYTFDTDLNPKDSLLNLKGQGTDLTNALQKVSEEFSEANLRNIVLVSDGVSNLGFSPEQFAKTSKVPIFTIGIGDSSIQKDVLISEVVTNEVVYLDNKTPVDVKIKAAGYKNQNATVSLIRNGKVLETQNVLLGDDNFEGKIKFTFVPEKEGIEKYTLKITEFGDELTTVNNSSNFTVKVLKSKLKILVVSSSPSPEVSFLKRALETNKDFEVELFIQKTRSTFYQKDLPDFEKTDCLVFVNFPNSTTPANFLITLEQSLEKFKTPLLFINGNSVDFGKLKSFEKFLPVSGVRVVSNREEEVLPKITEQGLSSVLTRVSDSRNETSEAYFELPPTFYKPITFGVNPSAKILLEIDFQRSLVQSERVNSSLVLTLKNPVRKSLWIGNYGLWKWNFQLWNSRKKNPVYEIFFTNAVKWLTTKEDSKTLRVSTNKKIYSNGEKVQFFAQTYDQNFNPLSGADVRVVVKNEDFEQEVIFKEIGNGRYEGDLKGVPGGDYKFTGKAIAGDTDLGVDKGEFSVEEKGIEYLQTRMNNQLLRKVSHNSNGKFFTFENVGEIREKLDLTERITENTEEIELWNKIWLLVLAISLLSIEWFIRKRSGMV